MYLHNLNNMVNYLMYLCKCTNKGSKYDSLVDQSEKGGEYEYFIKSSR